MSIQGRHSRTRHRWLPALGLIVLIALMSAATGAVTWALARNSDPAPAARAPSATGTTSSTSQKPRATAVSATLEACRTLWAWQVSDVLAADASLDQWRLHIDAMNQLTSGEITLTQATDYWQRTRLGAHRRVNDFRQVDRKLQSSSVRCGPGTGARGAGEQRQRLHACRSATDALSAALAAARVSIATWEHHIMDMDALRDGEITAEEATTMWLQTWRVGAGELRTYDKRAAEALHRHCG